MDHTLSLERASLQFSQVLLERGGGDIKSDAVCHFTGLDATKFYTLDLNCMYLSTTVMQKLESELIRINSWWEFHYTTVEEKGTTKDLKQLQKVQYMLKQ